MRVSPGSRRSSTTSTGSSSSGSPTSKPRRPIPARAHGAPRRPAETRHRRHRRHLFPHEARRRGAAARRARQRHGGGVLAQLSQKQASTILNEITPDRAAKLVTAIADKLHCGEEILMRALTASLRAAAGGLRHPARRISAASRISLRSAAGCKPTSIRAGSIISGRRCAPVARNRSGTPIAANLFRDPRAMRVGDVLTVNIAMNDKATLGNTSDRSTRRGHRQRLRPTHLRRPVTSLKLAPQLDSNVDLHLDGHRHDRPLGEDPALGRGRRHRRAAGWQPAGQRIAGGPRQLRTAAAEVAGIVRPRDISKDNTISYDQDRRGPHLLRRPWAHAAKCSSPPGASRSTTP